MDFLSLIWTVLRGCGVVIAAVLFVCVYLLVKEYGRTFIGHLFHRSQSAWVIYEKLI